LRLLRLYRVPAVAWTVKSRDDLMAAKEVFDGVIFEGDGVPQERYEKK
jgi:hypothetical protein